MRQNFSDILEGHSLFAQVADCGRQLEYPTYLVGGYVRDLILRRPSKDIDVVGVGSGIKLAECVAAAYGKEAHLTVYKNFGTALVKLKDHEVEFVGARKESYRQDSRKPIVENGTLEDDQNRRDFTINALAIGLNKEDWGDLIDPFGGLQDLENQLIRTPRDPLQTFSDDPLRMLRAIRFAAQLHFDIAPDTFDAIVQDKERINIVSKERIITELNKIIEAPKPSYGFKLLFHSGLLELIFPEMAQLQGVEKVNGQSHKDNFYHTLKVLDNVAEVSDNLWLRWGAILHDIAKPATKRYHPKAGWTFHGHEDLGARMVPKIFRKLKLPMNEKMRYVQKLVRLHLRPIALVKEDTTDSAIRRLLYETGDDLEDLMMLCRADITSKNDVKVKRFISNFDRLEKRIKEVEEQDRIRNFQPPVTGEDIMKTFNIAPSKKVGEIKTAVREAILDGKIPNDREQALAYMKEVAAEYGLQEPSG